MKKIFVLSISVLFYQLINAQELMKIREAFDFEIGDQYQSRTISGNSNTSSSGLDRISIIDKYYSVGNDTVFYIQFHDNYWMEPGSPNIIYHFYSLTDTIFFTALDSSMVYYDPNLQYSSDYFYSTQLCDSLINGCSYSTFENEIIMTEYGKGLGKTQYSYDNNQGWVYWYYSNRNLFYYKKGASECGTPDRTTVGLPDNNRILSDYSIYPNPAESVLIIRNDSPEIDFTISIQNSLGQVLKENSLKGNENAMDIGQLETGIYFLFIKNKTNSLSIKLMKN
jgi:hypothetical protein